MDTLSRNNQAKAKTFGPTPKDNTLYAIIAGFIFRVDFCYTKNLIPIGTCKGCNKEFNSYEEDTRDGVVQVINFLKIEEVQYNYKSFKASEVLLADSFVKEIFSKIIRAVKKQARMNQPLCNRCSKLTHEVVLWDPEKETSEFIGKLQSKILRLW